MTANDGAEKCYSMTDDDESSSNRRYCDNANVQCEYWASLGECDNNPSYMKTQCRQACGTCDVMISEAGAAFGEAQVLEGSEFGISRETIQQVVNDSAAYLAEVEAKEQQADNDSTIRPLCRNEEALCSLWAAMGECQANPTYMKKSCAPACMSCEYLTIEGRCPLDPDAPNAWEEGDLDHMFERLTAEPYRSDYQVEVLSSPALNDGPWIITMENVVTSEEAERLIELGVMEGYKESSEVGRPLADGTLGEKTSQHRTSYNAWCQHDCYRDQVALRVIHRLSNLTNVDETNSEYLQLLRYEPGQYYLPHHDYIPTERKRQQGVRILTVFLYLNDVEKGGETEFTLLNNLRVTPKRGRALIWPSVLDEAPNEMDPRMQHQALPVKAGIKYGANAWFHMRDFKTPNRNGCQG